MLDIINMLIAEARVSSTPIFYVQYTESDDSFRGKGQPLWEVHPHITPQKDDRVILKYHADL